MLVEIRLILGWNLVERLSMSFQHWNNVSIWSKYQPWLIWGWNEVGTLMLVDMRLKSWHWNNIETLTMVDMRLKSWPNFNLGWYEVDIVTLRIITNFQPWLKWGWYPDQISTLVEMRLIFWPNFNLGWNKLDILTRFQPWLIWVWYPDVETKSGFQANFNLGWYENDILTRFQHANCKANF